MSQALQDLYAEIAARPPLGQERTRELIAAITKLKAGKSAFLLTHNYQDQGVKEVADRLGDSYDLAVHARQVEADWIVFCGVRFMAETAKLLNPDRKVLLPESRAGCDLADSISGEQLRAFKKEHPGARTVMYINCNIDVKAEADAICTSANAVKVVDAMDSDTVIFGPDKNLGAHVARHSKKKVVIWQGSCPIHEQMSPDLVEQAMQAHPGAVLIVHPEVPPTVHEMADHILGTQAMIRYAESSPEQEFIIGTEVGLIERLQSLYPDKKFWPIYRHKGCDEACACPFMKITNLESIHRTLVTGQEEITIPETYRQPALRAVERMIEIGK